MLKKFPFIIILFVFVISCNNNGNKNQAQIVEDSIINARVIKYGEKLFEGINLPQTVFNIESDKEQKLTSETGTEILVPANAFVDKEGKDVKGKVSLKYKEIKTPSDMIVENVDMTYDSAGVSYQFQTAGMFDLRAFSDGKEAFLKKGKSIKVGYISEKAGDYNYYRYNGKWDYKGLAKSDLPLNLPNQLKTKTLILKPVQVNPSKDLIIDIKTDYSKIPELEMYSKIVWKYTGDLKNEEVANILSSNVYNTELLSTDISGKYLYRFKSKTGTYEFPVSPVFSPKSYTKALDEYNKSLASNSFKIKVKRTINVTELGLMNYDRIYHRSDAVLLTADFKVNNTKIQGLPLFHITGEDDVIVRVPNDSKIYYSPTLNNKIVAILPGKKVAVMSTAEFLKAVKASAKGQQLSLELKQLEDVINSADDLNKIISAL